MLLSRDYVLMWACLLFTPLAFFKSIADYAFMSFLSIACLFGLTMVIFFKAVLLETAPLPFNLKVGADPSFSLCVTALTLVSHSLPRTTPFLARRSYRYALSLAFVLTCC